MRVSGWMGGVGGRAGVRLGMGGLLEDDYCSVGGGGGKARE